MNPVFEMILVLIALPLSFGLGWTLYHLGMDISETRKSRQKKDAIEEKLIADIQTLSREVTAERIRQNQNGLN